jgi:hypothetical protein
MPSSGLKGALLGFGNPLLDISAGAHEQPQAHAAKRAWGLTSRRALLRAAAPSRRALAPAPRAPALWAARGGGAATASAPGAAVP